MPKKAKISIEHSCQIRSLYQMCQIRSLYQMWNIRCKKLLEMFPHYSKAQIYVHLKKKKTINGKLAFDKRKLNKGRPRKYSRYDQCSMT